MGGVLVLGELVGGALSQESREAVTAAASLGGVVTLVVPRKPDEHGVAVSGLVGASSVIALDLASADSDTRARAIESVTAEHSPDVVVAPHTSTGLAVLPWLAARIGAGLVTDVIALNGSATDVVATRMTMGGRVLVEVAVQVPAALTIRGGAFEAAADASMDVATQGFEATGRIQQLGTSMPESSGVDITQAPFILSVGRGVGDVDGLTQFAELAEQMGAVLGVSRPIVDAGWSKSDRQVGLSGKSVAPKVYLAFGISGAVQHLAGIKGANTVIAVNTDPNAPIFGVAQYGVVCDMFELAEELAKQS